MSRKKLSRRDLIRYASASSTLSFIPATWAEVGLAVEQSKDKPKLRSVIRLQMYAGWDVALSVDPPQPGMHTQQSGGKDVWMTQFNFPSGTSVDTSDLSFGNNASASVDKAILMDSRVKGKIGSEFFNNPDKGLRSLASAVPGKVPANMTNFVPVSGKVGNSGIPFAVLGTDPGWTKTAPQNSKIKFGPLMHQFMENIDTNPAAPGTPFTQSYMDYMTVINGIDTNNNVSHDFGAILAACGYPRAGVGNGADLTTIKDHMPSIECVMASQLIDPSLAGKLRIQEDLSPAFVAALTFSQGNARRGYAFSGSTTPYAQMYDMSSLDQIAKQTQLTKPPSMNQALINSISARMAGASTADTKQIVGTFKQMLDAGGLGLNNYDSREKDAFNGMIEPVYEKAPLTVGDTIIPEIKFRTNTDGVVTSDWRAADPASIRLKIENSVARVGSFQANLATAGRLVRQGYSRGVSISFGGHNDFIPDTHWHNDQVQMIYQGVFWDGVRRLVNYLMWNNDESGQPLINTTLVIVTADITRGPVYFDTGAQGKSDYRNNSLVLIGGGLTHKTKVGTDTKPGRIFGYSYGPLNSGRINYDTGKPTAVPSSSSDRNEEKISFANIYASLLEAYGMDKDRYFKDVRSIGPIVRNEPGDGNA